MQRGGRRQRGFAMPVPAGKRIPVATIDPPPPKKTGSFSGGVTGAPIRIGSRHVIC
jgi:hypothetical protein